MSPAFSQPSVVKTGWSRATTSVLPCLDRKSTRLNSSHLVISYAVFCLKKKKKKQDRPFDWAQCEQIKRVGIILRNQCIDLSQFFISKLPRHCLCGLITYLQLHDGTDHV